LKKVFKIIAFATISALYCFIISLYSTNAFIHNDTFQKHFEAKSNNPNSLILSHLLFHLQQGEIPAPPVNHNLSPSLANDFQERASFFPIAACSEFIQYCLHSKNQIVSLQSTDIIFPFHYFW